MIMLKNTACVLHKHDMRTYVHVPKTERGSAAQRV